MSFARKVFTGAGVWGLVVLAPLFFTLNQVGSQYPPPVTHPEFYYGFVAVGIAWQIGFLVIGRDPVRLRPMMIPAVLEKFIFVGSLCVLYMQGSLRAGQFAAAGPDLLIGILFIVAFFKVDTRS